MVETQVKRRSFFTYEGVCIIALMNFLRGFVMSFFIIRLFFDFVHLKLM